MRILICSNFYPPNFIGGAELMAHQQARELVAQGHQVQVFAGDTSEHGQRYQLRSSTYQELPVHRVHLAPDDFRNDLVNFIHPQVEQHFEAVLSQLQPEVVHFHNLVGLSTAIIGAAARRGARTVVTFHDHWGFCFKNTAMKSERWGCVDFSRCEECLPSFTDPAGRALPIQFRQSYLRLCLESADALVSPSEYLADAYVAAGFPADRLHVIWYGVDVERFARVRREPADRVRFTFVGILAPHKGVTTLIEAAARIDPRRSLINVVGGGDQPALERAAAALGVNHVRFWGKVPSERVEEVYRETDVLVLPSLWRENQPLTITEAMASGLPVIGSRAGGIPELVEDGVTGLLFAPGDAQELAGCMSRLIADPRLLEAMGAAGRERMATNSIRRQVARLIALYQGLAARPPRAGGSRPVVACAGDRLDERARAALALVPGYLGGEAPLTVMAGWPLPPSAATPAFFAADAAGARAGRRGGFRPPAVVPAAAAEAGEQPYSDPHEAAAALAELIRLRRDPA